MKSLLFVLLALTSLMAFAADDCETIKAQKSVKEQLEIKTDVPKWLEGATITVRLANGKESTVKAEQFKVVPRKQQFIVTHDLEATHLVCKAEQSKNRVSVLGGYGSRGLKVTTSGTTVSIEEQTGLTGGLQYQRKITDKFSIGGQVQTNNSGALLFGVDF